MRFELHKEEGFRVETDALISSVLASRPDMIALVNPNSPTGQYWPHSEALRFLDRVPESTKVVIDETYIEYVAAAQSLECEARLRSNVVVLKSMSKVYALSGMRAGFLVGHPSVIRLLAQWIPPWAVSLPVQVAVVEALNDAAYYEEQYRCTRAPRDELIRELRKHSQIRVYPSDANFVLVETESSAQQILEEMSASSVFVRNCDSMGLRFADRFLRIAVKRRRENARIVKALASASACRAEASKA